MRWSAEKLRWLALGGALLLAAVVAAFFGLARYTRGKVWQRILARNGVNLVQESDSITFSQSKGGRTVFTVHAAKSVPHGKGMYTLRDVVLILYGKDGHNDRISGNQFEYDQNQGVLKAQGEVHLDLQAPPSASVHQQNTTGQPLTFSANGDSEDNPSLIHVRTSGLVYVRKLGVAATSEMAEFRYGGMTCTSRGAEFDSGQDTLRLLADVRLTGKLRNQPFTLTAERADLDRTEERADLREPRVSSGVRSASAVHAVLHLRKDGSLEVGDAEGDVRLVSGTATIGSPQLHGEFGAEDKLQHAVFTRGVTFADTDPARLANGSAQTLDLRMNSQGVLSTATGDGGVMLAAKQSGSAGAAASRQMHAQRAMVDFVPDPGNPKRAVMRLLQMNGAAEFSAESAGKGLTRVDADTLSATFAPGAKGMPEPQRLAGSGNTQLAQNGADGQHQVSTGESLDVSFAERPGANGNVAEISTARQSGHVVLHSWPAVKPGSAAQAPSTGYAQQALFEAAQGTLTLTGAGDARAEVDDGETQLRAPKIVLHQGTGDGEATGGVIASSGREPGEETHVLAERADLLHAAGLSEFFGTDAEPVRMWQGGSQVQAAKVVLDAQRHTLSARPQGASGAVNAVFASARSTEAPHAGSPVENRAGPGGGVAGSKLPEASRDAVLVRAAAMDYSDAQHQATFNGGVQMRDPAGVVAGNRAAVFLQAPAKASAGPVARTAAVTPNMGGKLERAVVIGDVRVTEPGRTGAGEQITYTAASNSFVLTGTAAAPPWVRDQQQGYVTGTALVFGASDSSIVVTGTHAPGNQGKPTRVHTETEIKQP